MPQFCFIFSGPHPDSDLRRTLCGTENPGTVYVRTREAYLRFHSDHQNQSFGFTLHYQQISQPSGEHYTSGMGR